MGDGPSASGLPNGAAPLADPALARPASMQEWFEVTKEGRMDRMMPPWKNRLSDEEIWDAVAFAYSLHVTDTSLDQGEVVWGEQCSQCHGPQGAGDGPEAVANGWQMPDLSDLNAATAPDEEWFQTVSDGGGNMPAFSSRCPRMTAGPLCSLPVPSATSQARTPTPGSRRRSSLGKVVNNTAGGEVPAGAVVTLHPFETLKSGGQ